MPPSRFEDPRDALTEIGQAHTSNHSSWTTQLGQGLGIPQDGFGQLWRLAAMSLAQVLLEVVQSFISHSLLFGLGARIHYVFNGQYAA